MPETRRAHLHELVSACPEMTRLTQLVGDFARIMTKRRGEDLDGWMKQARHAGLPELELFLRGLDQDHDAAVAGLTLPYSNGPCEGVNTKTKVLKRQCTAAPNSGYSDTGSCSDSPPPKVRQSRSLDRHPFRAAKSRKACQIRFSKSADIRRAATVTTRLNITHAPFRTAVRSVVSDSGPRRTRGSRQPPDR
ncbi:transposase [Nocardia beijingensis]|uniref:transposase n=1 Tax=Nocardia beijingensis TaxID=95162 RepID=UPI0033C41AF1